MDVFEIWNTWQNCYVASADHREKSKGERVSVSMSVCVGVCLLWIKGNSTDITNSHVWTCLHPDSNKPTVTGIFKTTGKIRLWSESYWVIYNFIVVAQVLVMSDSLRPHGLQHARLPRPSPSPGACSNSRPLSGWCYRYDNYIYVRDVHFYSNFIEIYLT